MSHLSNISRSAIRQFLILFYFTKTDFKTTVFPVTTFASVVAPLHSGSHLISTLFWVWLHLLQFNVANQIVDPEEDRLNKPHRPIPSGRITLEDARVLRWVLVPICLVYSASFSKLVLGFSALLSILFTIYNDLHWSSSHWTIRNSLNAAGLGCFEAGATLISGSNRNYLDKTSQLALCLSLLILVTTYHAQDFRDMPGDKLIGRRTLPLDLPLIARPSIVLALFAWSVGLSCVWHTDAIVSAVFVALAIFIGYRFVKYQNVSEDKKSFAWYNLWLLIAQVLPVYGRLQAVIQLQ